MNKKPSYLVDTNIILRFLMGDQLEQMHQAEEWFKQARQGEINLVITPLVVAESCFVLESFYQVKRELIAQKMIVLLGQRWLQVKERAALTNLWKSYQEGQHFVDSYLLALARISNCELLTFDQKLKKQAS